MSYGKVKDSFWTDKKVQSFSDDAKLLALYFMTGPHRNVLGCMRVPDGYVMEDLGWERGRLDDAIEMLCERRFICRDDDGWTLILNQLKHDPIKVPNHAIAAIHIADTVPEESLVYQALVPRLQAALEGIDKAPSWHPKAIPDAIAIPEPEPEPIPEPDSSVASPDGAATRKQVLDELFDDFKSVFPKREPRHDWTRAREKFDKRIRDGTEYCVLRAAAVLYRNEVRAAGKEGTEFVKMASTWLNKDWADYAAEVEDAGE